MTARPTAAARFTAGCIALFALFARACAEPDCPTSTPPGPSDGHAWRRALGATALISAAPTAILPLIPASAAKGDRVQKTLVAFAIGGLLGDVFLHSMLHLLSPHDEHHHHVGRARRARRARERARPRRARPRRARPRPRRARPRRARARRARPRRARPRRARPRRVYLPPTQDTPDKQVPGDSAGETDY